MLKVFIDGKNFQDQMRKCEVKESQEFHLRLVKIDHDKLGKWDIYFESIKGKPQQSRVSRNLFGERKYSSGGDDDKQKETGL